MDANQKENSDSKLWIFKVLYEQEDNNKNIGTVCISGDCDSLGNWSTSHIVPLVPEENGQIWSVSLHIPNDQDVHYRYFVCSTSNKSEDKKLMIHHWETNLQPRIVKKEESTGSNENGLDVYGLFENSVKLENGWLTNDVSVQLRLNKNSLSWVSAEQADKQLYVKLRPALQRNGYSEYIGKQQYPIMISMSNEDGKFHSQNENGYSFNDVDSVVFMTRTFSLEQLGFVFEFSEISDNETSSRYHSYLMLENIFHGSDGTVKIPILSQEHEYLGNLTVKYLIIRPTLSLNCTFKVSYAKYWNNSWTGLEIGHRGAGVSFSKFNENNAKLRENTIGSFKSACQCGAQLIEFDVQLTNDLIPTIYHDFHVLLEVQNKMTEQKRKMIFPFHKLNYEELKAMKIHHLNEISHSFSFENDDQEDYSPFPSLEQVLQSIDPQIGFNIEIKYNSKFLDGRNELDHPIDMNDYVDKILEIVYANANRRYIVFSSFNPDICAMARLKQNKYPVMFLTQGVTKKYEPYLDSRMRNIQNAIHFVNTADLLGIVAHSEDLLKDYNLVKFVLNSKLVLFCWGEENNDHNNICMLKQQGVHGIIFDRIDEFGQKLKRDLFENEKMLQ